MIVLFLVIGAAVAAAHGVFDHVMHLGTATTAVSSTQLPGAGALAPTSPALHPQDRSLPLG